MRVPRRAALYLRCALTEPPFRRLVPDGLRSLARGGAVHHEPLDSDGDDLGP